MNPGEMKIPDWRTDGDKVVCEGCANDFGKSKDCMTRCFIDACALDYQRSLEKRGIEYMGVNVGACLSHAARNLPVMEWRNRSARTKASLVRPAE